MKLSCRKNIIVGLVLSTAIAAPASYGKSPLDGLSQDKLTEKIREVYRPERYPALISDINNVIRSYSGIEGGLTIDCFSAKAMTTVSYIPVAAPAWWDDLSETAALIKSDLHNLLPGNGDVVKNKNDYPPGIVTEAEYDNGVWKAGTGIVSGIETNMYQPPEKFKGDIARIYMYMGTLYPSTLWHGRGIMLYVDGMYPILNSYGRELLMKWHREDPVDDFELTRDNANAAYQGNHNPFVVMPELAEYIWGNKMGEAFGEKNAGEDPDGPTEPEKPDNPDNPPASRTPLKAVYCKSSEGQIDLISPYIKAGSKWTVDGKAVEGDAIKTDALDIGRHELRYVNDKSRGRIIIELKP